MTGTERTARAALSRLFEPQDSAGLALVHIAGAEDALRIATGQLATGPELEREMSRLLEDNTSGGGWTGLGTARKRWAPRVPDLAPERDLATLQRLGGRMIIPRTGCGPGSWRILACRNPCASGGAAPNRSCLLPPGPLPWSAPATAPPTAPP